MAISYVGRSEGLAAGAPNAPAPTSANATAPSGSQTNDLLVMLVSSAYDSSHQPSVPGAWSQINTSIQEPVGGIGWHSAWYTYYNSVSNAGPWTVTNVGYPDLVVRAYRGVRQTNPIDQSNKNFSNSGPPASVTIGALSATAFSDEWYVIMWVCGGQVAGGSDPQYFTSIPGDITNHGWANTQWNTYDGDKNMGSAGSTPGAESIGNSSGSALVGFAFTLIPAPAQVSSPSPPSVGGGNPIIVIRGEAWD